jgi:PmbA protein
MMNVDAIINNLDKKVDCAELYIEQEESTDVEILNDKVNTAKEENIKGVGIRVIKDNKQGFAYTTNLDRIDLTINQAIMNAKLNEVDENIAMIDNSHEYKKVDGLYDKKLEDFQLKEAIDFSNNLIDLVKEKKCNPTSGGIGVAKGTVSIINTYGVNVSESTTSCAASIEVNVEDGDVVSNAYYFDASHDYDIDSQLIVDKATALALNSRNAQPTHTRDTQVILDYNATRALLSTFFSALNSENKQRGRSCFKDKLNEKVASENFTLIDDGTIPGALCSSICDDEATPSQKTTLIEDGILKSFIYDIYHANKDEDDVATTANAVRSGYTSVPSIGFSNLKLDFAELNTVEDITNGIIVDSVMGAHTANPITGDFSVEARNAFEIKNGEITTPIKKAMISGNIFTIMEEAKAASKETRQLGSCITPKLYANSLRVIGSI